MLDLVRSSHHPERCLQAMRARAAAFFDSGYMGVVDKGESREEGHGFVIRLQSGPPPSMAVSEKESTTKPVEEPPVEDEVTDEMCSGIGSSLKIVPHLSMQSKASMIIGCTGGDVHDLGTGQDNTLTLMDIRSEQNERQAEEFSWQLLYPILIFIFDPGELTCPSMLPSMPSNTGGGTAAHGGLDLQGEQDIYIDLNKTQEQHVPGTNSGSADQAAAAVQRRHMQ